jgi:xylan 1,4-beta-xylosidase
MINFKINPEIETKFPHYWEMCIGSSHAYTALRADYREQLKKSHDELGFKYVRFHGLLDDRMSVLIRKKDFRGNDFGLVYNFMNVDNIIDYLLGIGMKPFLELGFMPTAIASGDKTVFHFKGNITPPKDYQEWENLIRNLVEHLIGRYGIEEVKTWFFEVWNEPNLFFFFSGTKEEYFKLYESTARTIKNISTELQVGGPSTSCNSWIKDTVDYCENNNVPLDFISTHHYPTDDPLWNSGMDVIDFYKSDIEGKDKYPRGVLKKMTQRVREEAGNYPVYFTEWNTSAMTNDSKHDEIYASAMIAKTLVDNDGLVDGYSYWTFSDIFEESAQLHGAFHGGFGLQTYAGIAKPSYRLFQLFNGLGESRLGVECSQPETTVEMIATKTKNGFRLIVFNHNISEEPIKDEVISINIEEITDMDEVTIYRIDENHANAKALWTHKGSPEYLSKEDISELHNASELIKETVKLVDSFYITVPAHGVVAIDVTF